MNDLEYIKETLSKHLGESVNTPEGPMRLVEIYANGNVACVSLKCDIFYYVRELMEFPALWVSITGAKQ
jgi:hypothetical protein